MKLLIALLATALLIVFGAAPYWLGMETERYSQTQLAQLEQRGSLPNWLKINLRDYQRGWFSATADTVVTLDMTQLAASQGITATQPELTLVFKHTILHGPLAVKPTLQPAAAVIETVLEAPAEYADVVRHYFEDLPPYLQTLVVGLDGKIDAEFTIPSYYGPSHDGSFNVDWQGLTGRASGHKDNITYSQLALSIPGLDIYNTQHLNLALTAVNFELDSQRTPIGLTLGKGNLNIGGLDFSVTDTMNRTQTLAAQKLTLDFSTALESDLLTASQTLKFNHLATTDFRGGPGKVHIQTRNLDANALAEYQQAARKLQKATLAPEQMAQASLATLINVLPTLLSRSPELEINPLNITTETGDIRGQARVSFDGSNGFDMATAAFGLAPYLSISADLSLPTAVARTLARSQANAQLNAADTPPTEEDIEDMTQQTLAQLETMNIIVPHNGHYTSTLRFKEGQLELNGQPTDILQLLQP